MATIENTPLIPTLVTLRAVRDEILALAEKRHAYHVRVFGSVARGEATANSDVDFLVAFREGATLYDLAGLRLDLMELLGMSVDVVEDHAGMRERFHQRIMEDVIEL